MPYQTARAALFGTLVFTLGCGSASETSAPASDYVDAKTTYYTDVKPIVDAKCLGCHSEGGIGGLVFETFEQVSAQKEAMRYDVENKIMPPWPADDDCRSYEHDRSLSDEQIALFGTWVDEGAAAGDPAQAGVPLGEGPNTLSRVDLALDLPAPYVPTDGPDHYQCFVFDWPAQATSFVTGFGVRPGNPQIVHHVIAYLAEPQDADDALALDAAEEGQGYTCFGGPGFKANWLGGWAPGASGTDTPENTGIRVEPGSKVVVQIHYNFNGVPEADQTGIDFKIDEAVEKEATIGRILDPKWVAADTMVIPPMTEDVAHWYAIDPTKQAKNKPVRIHAAGLHMHNLGTRGVLKVERANGSQECLLDIPSWDFHWQGSYELSNTVVVDPGDKLYLECHWNNTTSSMVSWGEGTGDEMCLGIVYATAE